MTLTTITTVLGLAASCAVAWMLGGREGTGVLAGFLAGAFIAGVALIAQHRLAVRRSELLAASVMASFLIKAFAMLVLTLTVRYVAPLAEIADARTFLFGYAGATLLVLAPATLDTLRALQTRRALDTRRKTSSASVGEARPT